MAQKDENSPLELWARRSNSTAKLNLSTHKPESDGTYNNTTAQSKRFGGGTHSSHGSKSNPFNPIGQISTGSVASPTAGSSAFALGTGAFASFGSAAKTPKSAGNAFDFGKPNPDRKDSSSDKEEKDSRRPPVKKSQSTLRAPGTSTEASSQISNKEPPPQWSLKYTWIFHYRPPSGKNSDYEKSIRPLCKVSTVQEFWTVYSHFVRPSMLPTVSDYHIFREGIRPVWEDEENKRGGKWTMRVKKGVADRYWEDLLLALIGDQFAEASDEVCGVVVSVRSGEDVFSIWTKNDGGRNVKIRETIKRVLALPADTNLQFRSHDESITQRDAADQARKEKVGQLHNDKRRNTINAKDATADDSKS